MPAGPSWVVEAAQLLLSASAQNYNFPPELVVCRADLCAVVLLWSSSAAAWCWACHRDAAALCRAALDVSFYRAPCRSWGRREGVVAQVRAVLGPCWLRTTAQHGAGAAPC